MRSIYVVLEGHHARPQTGKLRLRETCPRPSPLTQPPASSVLRQPLPWRGLEGAKRGAATAMLGAPHPLGRVLRRERVRESPPPRPRRETTSRLSNRFPAGSGWPGAPPHGAVPFRPEGGILEGTRGASPEAASVGTRPGPPRGDEGSLGGGLSPRGGLRGSGASPSPALRALLPPRPDGGPRRASPSAGGAQAPRAGRRGRASEA